MLQLTFGVCYLCSFRRAVVTAEGEVNGICKLCAKAILMCFHNNTVLPVHLSTCNCTSHAMYGEKLNLCKDKQLQKGKVPSPHRDECCCMDCVGAGPDYPPIYYKKPRVTPPPYPKNLEFNNTYVKTPKMDGLCNCRDEGYHFHVKVKPSVARDLADFARPGGRRDKLKGRNT